jgi:hypothetical protein
MEPPSSTSIQTTSESQNNLDLLPDEIFLHMMLEIKDLKTLNNWCRTYWRANNLCRDEIFWRQKYKKDFGGLPFVSNLTWQKRYKYIANSNFNSPLSAGYDYMGIINDQGQLNMAGNNDYGQLGIGEIYSSSTNISNPTPHHIHPISFTSRVIQIICTKFRQTVAVTEDGNVYIWGTFNNFIAFNKPFRLPFQFKVRKVAISPIGAFMLVISNSYDVYYIYDVYYMYIYHSTPLSPIKFPIKAVQIGNFGENILMLTTSGEIYMSEIPENSDNDITIEIMTKIEAPELIKRIYSYGTEGNEFNRYFFLSVTGNVYTRSILTDEKLEKISFPTPISTLSINQHPIEPIRILAIDINGRLYMSKGKPLVTDTLKSTNLIRSVRPVISSERDMWFEIVEVSVPSPSTGKTLKFKHVAVGIYDRDQILAVSDDGVVNIWNSQ